MTLTSPDSSQQNYQAWNIEPLQNIEGISKEEFLLHLIGWAILAPSSHNVQPWRFVVDPSQNSVHLCVHLGGILIASDAKGRQAFISLGCALENLLCAAKCFGFHAESYFRAELSKKLVLFPTPAVTVRLTQKKKCASPCIETLTAMKGRRVNRGTFDPMRAVPPDILSQIRKYAKGLNLSIDVITDVFTRNAIAELQYVANQVVVQNEKFRKELCQFLLPNTSLSGIGMPGNTFGLSDEMSEEFHEKLGQEGIFDPHLAMGFAASDRDGIKSSPAIVVVSIRYDNPHCWIEAGMALGYAARIAETHGLSLAVHAALVEVGMSNMALKARLKRFKERPTVLFRIGYGKESRPHAPRLGVADVATCSEGETHEGI